MENSPRLLLFAGTKKGAFIFESDPRREGWAVNGPHFPGWSVYHMVYDARNGILFAALDHMVYGSNIHRSFDLGENWQIVQSPAFAAEDGRKVARIGHIQPAHPDRPETLFAGVDPGALFRSNDYGAS